VCWAFAWCIRAELQNVAVITVVAVGGFHCMCKCVSLCCCSARVGASCASSGLLLLPTTAQAANYAAGGGIALAATVRLSIGHSLLSVRSLLLLLAGFMFKRRCLGSAVCVRLCRCAKVL
jgi:hypothetical protein